MYASVRNKISRFSLIGYDDDYYFDSCEYRVRCVIDGDYIRKTILKKIDVRSYQKIQKHDFPLCVTTFPEIQSADYIQISFLKINGTQRNLQHDIRTETGNSSTPLLAKSGYFKQAKHTYVRSLSLSPDKPTIIEIEYTTVVPKNDTVYICRVSSPCRKFNFHFYLDGNNKSKHRINLSAFGFIDDGSSTPNHHDDTPSVSITLDDWIFPRDGVTVTIMEKTIVPALQIPQ